jgi:hypothetical protein
MSSSGIRFAEIQMTGTSPTDSEHHFSGQAYLTNLTDGIHSITVYYGVLVNVGSPYEFIVYNASWSATSQFYVDTEATLSPSSIPQKTEPQPEPTPFLTTLVVASAVSVGIIGAGLLFYLKKYNH